MAWTVGGEAEGLDFRGVVGLGGDRDSAGGEDVRGHALDGDRMAAGLLHHHVERELVRVAADVPGHDRIRRDRQLDRAVAGRGGALVVPGAWRGAGQRKKNERDEWRDVSWLHASHQRGHAAGDARSGIAGRLRDEIVGIAVQHDGVADHGIRAGVDGDRVRGERACTSPLSSAVTLPKSPA